MSGQTGDQEDRTEAPTARRLQKARDEGQIPVSREAVTLAGLAAIALTFTMLDGVAGRMLVRALITLMGHASVDLQALFHEAGGAFLRATALFAVPAVLGATAATLAQTRFALRAKAVRADFGRLSPMKGLKRMFGAESLVETLKSLAKLGIVGLASVHVLRQELPRLESLPGASLTLLPEILASIVIRLLCAAVLAQLAIAGADLFWIWRQHQRQLRMSRSDIRDEQKETDGDPAIKARIRRIRMRRARQRMLAAVPKATVVVTNPTHYAVALSYDDGSGGVPILVAKGVDSMAARIRDVATQNGIPIVADPPLARTLHRLPLNARIPPELYKAVAELIAYVWRLNGRRRA